MEKKLKIIKITPKKKFDDDYFKELEKSRTKVVIIRRKTPRKINGEEKLIKMKEAQKILDNNNLIINKDKDSFCELDIKDRDNNKVSQIVSNINEKEAEIRKFEEEKKSIELKKAKKIEEMKKREKERKIREEEERKRRREELRIKREKEEKEQKQRLNELRIKREKEEEERKKKEIRENVENKINIKSLRIIIQESIDPSLYPENDFPFFRFFMVPKYANKKQLIEELNLIPQSEQKYPIITNYLKDNGEIEVLQNLIKINPFVNSMIEIYTYKITREEENNNMNNNEEVQKVPQGPTISKKIMIFVINFPFVIN